MVQAWRIRLAPSVLFFGADGVEIVPRLVGAGSMDYYGAYLDQRLSQARAAITASLPTVGTLFNPTSKAALAQSQHQSTP